MQQTEGLSTASIANPRLWRLGMELDLGAATIDVAATSMTGEEAMLCRRIELAQGVPMLRALEDAVYDNPMLLADFERITLLLRTPRFALFPAAVAADEDTAAKAAELMRMNSRESSDKLLSTVVPGTGAAVMCAIPQDIAAFLGRTFADAAVTHSLTPLLTYFAAKSQLGGNSPKIFAVASATGVDLMAFDGARLLGATSYACLPDDMAYYTAALAQVCGIASPGLQFHVAGAPGPRDILMAALRSFAPQVMPCILPAGAIADGAGTNTPFSLLILPLCE